MLQGSAARFSSSLRARLLGGAISVVALVASSGRASAAESEVRQYDISVGSDKVGTTRITITKQDDASTLVKSEADVKVSILWVKITYWFRGYELWKDGALQRLASNCYDDGDRRAVEAVLENNALRVKVNGKAKTVAPGVWTTSYWTLPPADARPQPLRLFDADSGKEQAGRLRLIGKEQCAVGGKGIVCTHYRVNHDDEIDLWFDDAERLVRTERTKIGKRVVMALTSVSH